MHPAGIRWNGGQVASGVDRLARLGLSALLMVYYVSHMACDVLHTCMYVCMIVVMLLYLI